MFLQALPAIEILDVPKDGLLSLSLILEQAMMFQLVFQGAVKDFHDRIVIAVALATAAQHDDAAASQKRL